MPGTVELSALNGTNGFRVNGISTNDLSGFSVSAAGDVNNDGFDDILIGALCADPNGSRSGQSYVVYGGSGDAGDGRALGAQRHERLPRERHLDERPTRAVSVSGGG